MPEASTHPYAAFLARVAKPARYTGGEHGAKPKPWNQVEARVCLAFPDLYDIGMSHLGFKILYDILNGDPRTLAERAFCPWIDLEAELRSRGLPLVSLESWRPLSEFDMVGISLQHELSFTNVLTMLDLGGVPLRARSRSEDDPIVVAGGPTATHPEPVAPFFDAIVIGDGEELAKTIALDWCESKRMGLPRRARLERLARLRGVYVPELYTTRTHVETGLECVEAPKAAGVPFPIERAMVHDLDAYPFPADGPVGGPEAVFDRMSIEIARGCTEGCRFCQAGMIYRPVRERSPERIVDTLERAVETSGFDEVSLTSLSTADYSSVAPLIHETVERLAPKQVSLGVSSLRAYGLSDGVLDDMRKSRATGLTFAPEAGTQRMRDVINKNVTEEQLAETADRVFSRGWEKMKLYFIIGLPTETEEDVREIPRVGGRTRQVGRAAFDRIGKRGSPRVTVSVSSHVPKPHTPFQWCAMDTFEAIETKQRWLREEARAARVDLRTHAPTGSWLEGVLARGGRQMADAIELAYKRGARFDSWDDQLDLDRWRNAFKESKIEADALLRTVPLDARLPWDHIDVGLEDGFLEREYKKALGSRLSPPCGKANGMFVHHATREAAEADARRLVCYDCGIGCDLDQMRSERIVAIDRLAAVAKARHVQPAITPPDGSDLRIPYRFVYTKLGASAFLSHLDLIRALGRVFRRANIRVSYTRGFHPKPAMSFGPALSLGVPSACEIVDVKLAEPIELDGALARLSAASDAGVEFLTGTRLAHGATPLAAAIDCARYLLVAPPSMNQASIAALGEAFLARESFIVERRFKGRTKRIDLKEFVLRLVWDEHSVRAANGQTQFDLRSGAFVCDVAVRPDGSAKASEVAEALFGDQAEHAWLARVAMGRSSDSGVVSPIELAHESTAVEVPANEIFAAAAP